ncbi:MAG: SGNH/GDSL hydrolase family protein [Phycisphaeraceae bacterium]|nr:SGNH/GDSL hydrolase family protein [Phycisphaeraceae bacterium]
MMLRVSAAVCTVVCAHQALGQTGITRLGALGDSLSDEYLEESYSYARGWAELLVQERAVSMGPAASGGCRPEPRRCGYEDNWARSGHKTGDVLLDGAHLGLAEGALYRGVTHATILVGTNDFSPLSGGAYAPIYNGTWTQAVIDDYIAERVDNIRVMLDTVQPAGVRCVLISPVDIGYAPLVRSLLYPNASRRQRVANAMTQFADELRLLAAERRIVFLDVHAMTSDMFGMHNALRTSLRIGDTPINLNSWNFGGSPAAGWVQDGVHPNTPLQAVFTAAVIEAFNRGWGTTIEPLTEAQMLAAASLPYGGSDTLAAIVGDFGAYISVFRCPADLTGSADPSSPLYGVADGVVDAADFFYFLDQFEAGNLAAADLTGSTDPASPAYGVPDGVIDAADFFFYLDLFVAGCA